MRIVELELAYLPSPYPHIGFDSLAARSLVLSRRGVLDELVHLLIQSLKAFHILTLHLALCVAQLAEALHSLIHLVLQGLLKGLHLRLDLLHVLALFVARLTLLAERPYSRLSGPAYHVLVCKPAGFPQRF